MLDYLLEKNPVKLFLGRLGIVNPDTPGVKFAVKHMSQRRALFNDKTPQDENTPQTLTDKFFAAKDAHPEVVSDKEVLGLSLSMVFAGSEST
jgi:cytochrome P450